MTLFVPAYDHSFWNRGRRVSDNLMMLKQVLILAVAAVVSAQDSPQLQATVRMADPKGTSGVGGNLTFTQLADGRVHLQGTLTGLPEGDYGFHVHEKGDITGGCLSTGAHFNPEKKLHGHPEDEERHVGDLGNIHFDAQHVANIDLYDRVISLTGPHSILGRAVVLHEKADDFGRTLHPDSKKTGNAGGRVSCGVIGIL